ncbi:DUF4440 domain-containing protein [Schumannella soli]|uniref:DUF4440 domain-containing protein n=1 Tax=Schumannella soli TaxID=2590779 RepID=A0A506XZZ4_9MICO|nr:DUF4440 domain-containing protein [Schumannella soli]
MTTAGAASAPQSAIDAIIAAFGDHRRDDYFAGFAADATFVFPTNELRLESRAEYEAEWERWEREDGFRVLRCASTRRRLQLLGDDIAVFSHDVETALADGDGEMVSRERETIVVQRREGVWLGVHEHLSPHPAD